MITFLDLLIIVSMLLIAGSLLATVLMFLVKNKKVRQVCFYITVGLSLYISYVGLRINWPDFYEQAVMAVVFAVVSITALVLTLTKKDDEKVFLTARLAAAAALVFGVCNALLI